MHSKEIYPQTIDSAVDYLLNAFSQNDLNKIKNIEEDGLWDLHMNLGQGIRNSFGLWGDNKALLRSCGSEDMHADDASSSIVKLLWLKLRHEK